MLEKKRLENLIWTPLFLITEICTYVYICLALMLITVINLIEEKRHTSLILTCKNFRIKMDLEK